jgi:hypothetical protein
MRRGSVSHCEGGEVHAGMAREGRLELVAKRRVGGFEQRFDVAAREHCRHVAGAGEPLAAIGRGIDLNGHRRRGKARARERVARRSRIAHKVADMVEEDLLAQGKLTVCGVHQWTFSRQVSLRRRTRECLAQCVPAAPLRGRRGPCA